MAIDTVGSLVDTLRQHRILESSQLDEIARTLQPRSPDPRALAKELLQRGWLTAYQVNQLLQGRAADLVLGSYVLLERIGEGGMGQVFKARHQKLGRVVALKVIRKDRLANAEAVRRFHREIQAVAQLSHANVVLAFDASQVGETHYFAMEFVEGTDLGKWVKERGPVSVADGCEYIRQAALGLQHAFERGLVHRDIKPSNLMLTAEAIKGTRPAAGPLVKLMDLGLARLNTGTDEESSSTLTQAGAVVGTPDYISPEQARDSRAADIRADLYSLGCTFYYVLTGQVPFQGGTLTEKLLKHHWDAAVPVEKLRPEVPPGIAAIIRKLMAKTPEDRYQTPAEVATAIESVQRNGGAAIKAGKPRAGRVVRRPPPMASIVTPAGSLTEVVHKNGAKPRQPLMKRRWLLLGAGGTVGALLLLCGLGLALRPSGSGAERATKNGGSADDKGTGTGLDKLSAKKVPRNEWHGWQPPDELVAVLGEHRGRHYGNVRAVAFSPDGTLLASAGTDWAVRIWDQTTMREQAVIRPGAAGVFALAFVPKSKTLAMGLGDGTVQMWDLNAGQPRLLHTLRDHKGTVFALAFSADGKLLVTGDQGGQVHFWDNAGTKPTRGLTLKEHDAEVFSLALSPDTKLLVSGGNDRTMKVWDLGQRQAKVRESLPSRGAVHAVAFSANGELLASGSEGGALRLWDVANGTLKERGSAVNTNAPLFALTFTPNGQEIITGLGDGSTAFFEVVIFGLRAQARLEGINGVSAVAISPDGKYVASGTFGGLVRQWVLGGARPQERVLAQGHLSAATSVAFHPTRPLLASGSADQSVRLWDLDAPEPKELERVTGQTGGVHSVAIAANGKLLAASGGTDPQPRFWDMTGTRAREFVVPRGQGGGCFCVAFAPDSKTLAVSSFEGGDGGRIRFWDVTGPEPKLKPKALGGNVLAHTQMVTALAYAPGGGILASSSAGQGDWSVALWDPATGRNVQRYNAGANDAPWGLAISPDGRTLASSRFDGTVRLWDLNSIPPKDLPVLRGHRNIVWSVAFSPDSKTLASVSADGKLILWDWATGKQRRDWPLPGGATGVSYSADGRYLAVALLDGTVFIFRLGALR